MFNKKHSQPHCSFSALDMKLVGNMTPHASLKCFAENKQDPSQTRKRAPSAISLVHWTVFQHSIADFRIWGR